MGEDNNSGRAKRKASLKVTSYSDPYDDLDLEIEGKSRKKKKKGEGRVTEATNNVGDEPKHLKIYARKKGNKAQQEIEAKRPIVQNDKEDNADHPGSNMCHQCQRNDNGRVVRCQLCPAKRYCISCLTRWYPKMSEHDVAQKCPFCFDSCNCRACLRLDTKMKGLKPDIDVSEDEDIQCSNYIIHCLLPHLKEINDVQNAEKKLEAQISGLALEELNPEAAKASPAERLYCDNCQTLIFDLYRSCSECSSDICLSCCQEIRKGKLQTCHKKMPFNYINRGLDYAHGDKGETVEQSDDSEDDEEHPYGWKANEAGVITCYRSDGFLKLKRVFPNGWVSNSRKQKKPFWPTRPCSFLILEAQSRWTSWMMFVFVHFTTQTRLNS